MKFIDSLGNECDTEDLKHATIAPVTLEALGVDLTKKLSCDFCGKTRAMVKALVIGGDGCICNQCVGQAMRELFKKHGGFE